MTKPEARIFLDEWWCGCGDRVGACDFLRKALALHPLFDHRKEFEAFMHNDSGLEYFVLYTLEHFDLNEHGGGIGGSWLTDKGTELLAVLNEAQADNYESLCAQACMHGYAVGTKEKCPSGECSW